MASCTSAGLVCATTLASLLCKLSPTINHMTPGIASIHLANSRMLRHRGGCAQAAESSASQVLPGEAGRAAPALRRSSSSFATRFSRLFRRRPVLPPPEPTRAATRSHSHAPGGPFVSVYGAHCTIPFFALSAECFFPFSFHISIGVACSCLPWEWLGFAWTAPQVMSSLGFESTGAFH